jgi:integrase
MASIRRRANSWLIDYHDPHGKRVRIMFKKKKDAEAELAKRVSLIAENRYLDVKKEYNTALTELVTKYTENYPHPQKKYYCQNFEDYFGEHTLLAFIGYINLEKYRNYLRRKPKPNGELRTDASVNREMSCLHHLFTKAVEWELIERSPFDRGKTLLVKENNKRLRFLTEDEITKLLGECPKYLRYIVECALNTGMRRGEILSLKWGQIRNGFIYLQQTKTNESRQIPINEDLERVFKKIRKEKELTSEYVFTYQGKPMKNIKKSFKAALKRAGIQDFRFHDLRHTFASHAIMRGASLKDVQEVLGHKTISMTLRYSHLTQEHKRNAVNLLNGLTGGVKSNLGNETNIASMNT